MINLEEPSGQTASVTSLAGISKARPLAAYATRAVLAISGYLWDPSPAKNDEGHCMPLPLYSSSPPHRQYLSNFPRCLSLLPYPDLFDFGMYASAFPSSGSLRSVSMNGTIQFQSLKESDLSGMSSGKSPQWDSYRTLRSRKRCSAVDKAR
ncbi:uncharacterized protein BT62DRAFT_229322 [Guyanagaster necrorhizus]|uniref:Uncharacterized protein n=1 Tax=Guyanagaster necrorhizus TaxID=856835 RepID=A0A9P8ARF2_9AGAR|nr:uncharacterized protein BT62DRAFT_229322 [Guyanagaster necrorhizus MCA 3950]KAG7444831.1 hypothetical protein BT62DRAFT_229322 [Guyanagaster necrorhizus MCA 3950]